MNICGFAIIKKEATTCAGAKHPEQFLGNICAIIDKGCDDSVMVLNPEGSALAMFEKEDVHTSFACKVVNGVVCPPGLGFIDETIYQMKCINRKGGYGPIVKNMVIAASLHKGTFTDSLLWAKQ